MLASILALSFLAMNAHAGDTTWNVTNDWSPALEKKFSDFVQQIGESGCKSLDACLKSPSSNPFYAARTPKNVKFTADCADYPYDLRMYFAWMEGLPFDYVSQVEQAEPEKESSGDIRYTKYGNRPAGWRKITKGHSYDGVREMRAMGDAISTATYRMSYEEVSDFYPPKIDPQHVRPGTAVYDPSGHAAIVYKIEKDGRVRMMDAHPDNSVTRITFDQKFVRSRVAHGAGFKNWRPELNYEPTENLPGFSTQEFQANYAFRGETLSFYDWVRAQMAGGSLVFSPVLEIKNMMLELCSNVHDREAAVRTALASGIQNRTHPDRLPVNIYGTEGDWESFSSPSRDARLKVAFVELRTETERYLTMYRQGSKRIQYTPAPSKYSNRCTGSDVGCVLAASLLSAYEEAALNPSCIFQYQKSDGSTQRLSYTDIAQRLFSLSFDPYHCAELRWGATKEELASCRDDQNKLAWYTAEQHLRNQTERTYDARMDATLDDAPSLGVANPPDVDLWGYLGSQLK